MGGVYFGAGRLWALSLGMILLGLSLPSCFGGEGDRLPRVTIASVPEAASIYINNVPSGQTPQTIERGPGERLLVVLKREGFKDAKELIEVPDSGDLEISLELEARVGYINITSKPDHAKVYLDGEVLLGVTPLVRKAVPVGVREFEFRYENYETVTETKEIREDFQHSLFADLRAESGEVTIFSRPTGAQIWINERLQEKSTPARFELRPGEYNFTVHLKGYVMAEATHVLNPNEEVQLELEMKPGAVPRGMILIPAGEFIMGTDGGPPDERPQRKEFVDSFYIDKYEVTNAEFKEVFPSHEFEDGFESFPVTGVTWKKATEFAAAVEKRLPTEAEWEKAARGTDGRLYPWGNAFNKELCNSGATYNAHLKSVGSFLAGASPYGVMDMSGNAREWVSDWYDAYPGNEDVTVEYGQVYRVLRGGSYLSPQYDVRCASRSFDRVEEAKRDYGFRCAKDVIESPE